MQSLQLLLLEMRLLRKTIEKKPAPLVARWFVDFFSMILGNETLISPLVLFSILDHHSRRDGDQEYSIGLLLGKNNQINNTLPIQYAPENHVIDMDQMETVLKLFSETSPREHIVGWYCTRKLEKWAHNIHAILRNECENAKLLIIDPLKISKDFPIELYERFFFGNNSIHVGVSESDSSYLRKIPVKVTLDNSTGLDILSSSPELKSAEVSDLSVLLENFRRIKSLLRQARNYITDLGDDDRNKKFGISLLESLSNMPDLCPTVVDKIVEKQVSDLETLHTLTEITRAQMQLAERLQKV